MGDVLLKICVVGPCKSGKTLLCRALAEQPIMQGEYQGTAAVRVQEVSRTIGVDRVKIQYWDCSGSPNYQAYWGVLAKELDGVLLVCDAAHPEQEKELETFYLNFAQPNNLTTRQCLVLAMQVQKDGTYGLGGWTGLQGKLSKLQQGFVSINPATPSPGVTEAMSYLDTLLHGCLQNKKDMLERSVVDE